MSNKNFTALTAWDEDNRVTKYEVFETMLLARAHAAKFGGFAAGRPSGDAADWLVNPAGNAVTFDARPEPIKPDSETAKVIKRLAQVVGADVADIDWGRV